MRAPHCGPCRGPGTLWKRLGGVYSKRGALCEPPQRVVFIWKSRNRIPKRKQYAMVCLIHCRTGHLRTLCHWSVSILTDRSYGPPLVACIRDRGPQGLDVGRLRSARGLPGREVHRGALRLASERRCPPLQDKSGEEGSGRGRPEPKLVARPAHLTYQGLQSLVVTRALVRARPRCHLHRDMFRST